MRPENKTKCHATENVATVYDFHATPLRVLGLDRPELSFQYNGIQRRLTDIHEYVTQEYSCLK
ncbi:MAG: DUF1501 domain-containing protein [Candidatus Poribacteria bacterium]|nr:DUF1501 domain-containing protein [Candidatus Poribacteria bacterium]